MVITYPDVTYNQRFLLLKWWVVLPGMARDHDGLCNTAALAAAGDRITLKPWKKPLRDRPLILLTVTSAKIRKPGNLWTRRFKMESMLELLFSALCHLSGFPFAWKWA
jgi:hypothetical protein